MDPFSVTLGAITIATAVKDIVELGQKIHESFGKVSDNFRNAQRVAEDIKEMVEEIEVFCEVHKDGLENMKDFRIALQGLLGKLRSFETSVLPLLPQASGRRRDRLVRGWNAWRNNNSIERSILDLQSDIKKVMRRFVRNITMRTEVKLETIHQETSKGISQGLEAIEEIRRNVSTLRITASSTPDPFEASGTIGNEFNRNIILFAQSTPSTSVSMLRTPDVITEELMTAAYIKFQINAIATAIERVSALPAFDAAPGDSIKNFELSVLLELASMDLTHLRHHIVRKVTEIRDLLDHRNIHTMTLHDGCIELGSLAYGLRNLDMGHEALLVGEWAITLARMLANASDGGRPDSTALLALYLLNQSIKYGGSGNTVRALQLIKEAYSISQKLCNQSSDDEVFVHSLHAQVLRLYARLLDDSQHSTRMLIEGITIFENILGVQAIIYHDSEANTTLVVQPSSLFFDHLFSSPLTATIDDYANTLMVLGMRLFNDGHHEDALDLVRLAIAVYRGLMSIHGPEWGVSLAHGLSALIQDKAANHIPAEELVDIADECIQLLRELAEKNPLQYAHNLVGVLSKKATALESLNRDSGAIATWEEAVNIAEQIVQDSAMCAYALVNLSSHFRRLQRYDDAVRTRKLAITMHQDADTHLRALRYYDLSQDLRKLHHFKESSETARSSVALYRQLTMTNPSIWMVDLLLALCELAHGLAALGDYPGVLIIWAESASIFENFLYADSGTNYSDSFVATSCEVLQNYAYISCFFENEEDCHQVSSAVCRYSQQFSETYPLSADTICILWGVLWRCSYLMVVVGRFQDAEQCVKYWLDMWSEGPTVAPDSQRAVWHTDMITLKSRVLYLQGCTEEALVMTQKARSVASLSTSTPLLVCFSMIDSMILEARMQLDLGNGKEALQVAEDGLQLSRDHKQELTNTSFVLSLHQVAVVALSCQDYTRSIDTAQEGCDICGTSSWQDDEDQSNAFLRPSFFAVLSSAQAKLGQFGSAVEHARCAVEASLDIREKKWVVSPATAESSYMETRGNLAEILLATGELAQAREICEERRAYFSERVEKRMGEYRDLAPILRILGVLCCAEGRHEEGEAAAQELSGIMQRLGCAFPSLQEQVKIRLRRQAEVPNLKVLDDMTQKLNCKHQAKVSSLYEIGSTSLGPVTPS